MVKFSKELDAQLVPEWKEKYVNYKQLKKPIKNIKLLRHHHSNHSPAHIHNVVFGRSIFDPLRKVSRWFRGSGDSSSSSSSGSSETSTHDRWDEKMDDYCYEEEEGGGGGKSELVHLFTEEDEVNRFRSLVEGELQKVDDFYRAKEAEVVERGEALNKQLHLLLTLKRVFARPRGTNGNILTRSNSVSLGSSSSASDMLPEYDASETIERARRIEAADEEEVAEALERIGVSFTGGSALWRLSSSTINKKSSKTTNSLRIDISGATQSNPVAKISATMAVLWEDLVNTPTKNGGGEFIRKKIQLAEKMIRGAFVEFYKSLGLLKAYSSLNLVAFTKIMKKFDKVANRKESAAYLKKVKGKQFVCSDKVVRLMDEVETLFIEHFVDNDRKKAMKFLKPQHYKDSHMLSFLVGLFTGCFISLFAVYAVLAHMSGLFSQAETTSGYMETVYPVFSMFALLSLHLFMYGCNLLMWKATRINYLFIFDFESRTALKHKDAFLISTLFMTTVVASLVIHLLLKSNGFPPAKVDALPSLLLLISIALLICPFKIFYRATRYCFIRVMRNIVLSPFCKVLMVDFFMADQLTSQIPLLRHIETTICYFMACTFNTHNFQTCQSGKLYTQLAYVISFSPYYWRAMQCARRWLDESDTSHLVNLGKYVSAMVAAGARLTYAQQLDSKLWLITVVVTSVIATMYQLYWDFKRDWGLFNLDSKNTWLRDNLLLKKKSVYYVSIGVNVILRVAWVESVLKLRVGRLESRLLDFFVASLEVIRRGHWNFYRLENEHLNNAGKFRAEKTVPLPFRETDSD